MTEPTPDTERYRQAMAAYPVCDCGQSLWAPASIERGYCEACRLRRVNDLDTKERNSE